jgi:small subunit ribosomal protein S1
VFLSIKALKKDPWQKIEKKLKKGDLISGKVKKLNPYGAQVEVLPKIQGLCHISEFGTIKKMEETLQPEKSYQFEILEINPAEHRLILKFVG